jgi:hypothetical protein
MMKDILLKLANGENSFECTVYGQKRICEIMQLDLWGLNEGKGRALVKFKEPVKKTIRREVENSSFGMDMEYNTHFEDVEVDTNQEWVNIG